LRVITERSGRLDARMRSRRGAAERLLEDKTMQSHNDGIPVELTVASVVFLAIAAFIVNVIFAIGITCDGDRIRKKGGETVFVGPNAWGARRARRELSSRRAVLARAPLELASTRG
jgi:hypothetical protein